MRKVICVPLAMVVLCLGLSTFAQQGAAPGKAPRLAVLLFREDFKATEKATEVQFTADGVTNPNLELKLYGPGSKPGIGRDSGLQLTNEIDPTTGQLQSIFWSGVTVGNWAVLFKDKNDYLDLRDTARLRWRIRPRGFHELRPVIKLADGTMLAADYAEHGTVYTHESEVYFADIPRWRALNPDTIAEARAKPGEGLWKYDVDLSKVDEIGFTDLMSGAGHGAQGNVAVDWIEVYGNPVKRAAGQSQAR